ncbi:MAG: PAS domain S-box protein [Deltaproteobacteria bacterium]|nr:PAS domain S-box protein [Deltaproteobacteria bacterium]
MSEKTYKRFKPLVWRYVAPVAVLCVTAVALFSLYSTERLRDEQSFIWELDNEVMHTHNGYTKLHLFVDEDSFHPDVYKNPENFKQSLDEIDAGLNEIKNISSKEIFSDAAEENIRVMVDALLKEADAFNQALTKIKADDLASFYSSYEALIFAFDQLEEGLHNLVQSKFTDIGSHSRVLLIVWAMIVVFVLGVIILFERRRERYEDELRTNEQKQFLHVEHTPLAAIEWNTDFEVIGWNPAAEKMFGFTKEEAMGRTAIGFIVPKSIKKHVDDIWASLLKNEGGTRSRNDNITKDGRIIICEWYNTPLIDKAGKVIGVASRAHDVTESIFLERELRERSNLLQTLLDTIPNPIFYKDTDEKYLGCNKAFEDSVGFKREELLGKTVYDVASKELGDKYHEMDSALLNNPGVQEYEFQVKYTDGKLHDVIFTKATYTGRDDNVAGLVGIMTDITERKREEVELAKAKESAEAASRAKSDFLASMSHEIRTPITAITGVSELLSDKEARDEEDEKYLDIISSASDTLLGLINDILDISKIEAGQLKLEEKPFSLEREVEAAVSLARVRAGDKNLRVELRILEGVPKSVVGDRLRLSEVLLNLVGNAVKFTERGEVKLEVTPYDYVAKDDGDEATLLFTIKDTGVGISTDKLESIFDQFSQADNSTTRKYGGSGLGLSISKKLVNLMGGRIWVESKEGRGSKFNFTAKFKIHSGSIDESHRKEAVTDKPSDSRTLKILLAEDSEHISFVIKTFLRDTPYSVELVENGAEALKKFKEEKYDLVLMDMEMPVMDGYEATRMIREYEKTNDLSPAPVVALTAHALKEHEIKCMEAGCTAHIGKPVKKPDLLRSIIKYTNG